MQQFPFQLRAARHRRAILNQDYAALELHYLAALIRDTDANLKRVSRPPFRMSFVATLVYMLYGRHQVENLGLKFETVTPQIES